MSHAQEKLNRLRNLEKAPKNGEVENGDIDKAKITQKNT